MGVQQIKGPAEFRFCRCQLAGGDESQAAARSRPGQLDVAAGRGEEFQSRFGDVGAECVGEGVYPEQHRVPRFGPVLRWPVTGLGQGSERTVREFGKRTARVSASQTHGKPPKAGDSSS